MDHISLIRYRASAFRLALSGIAAVAAMGMQPASAESGTLTVYTESNAAAGNQLLVFA